MDQDAYSGSSMMYTTLMGGWFVVTQTPPLGSISTSARPTRSGSSPLWGTVRHGSSVRSKGAAAGGGRPPCTDGEPSAGSVALNYCIGAGQHSKLLVENNYFDSVGDVITWMSDEGTAEVVERGNEIVNSGGVVRPSTHPTNTR